MGESGELKVRETASEEGNDMTKGVVDGVIVESSGAERIRLLETIDVAVSGVGVVARLVETTGVCLGGVETAVEMSVGNGETYKADDCVVLILRMGTDMVGTTGVLVLSVEKEMGFGNVCTTGDVGVITCANIPIVEGGVAGAGGLLRDVRAAAS